MSQIILNGRVVYKTIYHIASIFSRSAVDCSVSIVVLRSFCIVVMACMTTLTCRVFWRMLITQPFH